MAKATKQKAILKLLQIQLAEKERIVICWAVVKPEKIIGATVG